MDYILYHSQTENWKLSSFYGTKQETFTHVFKNLSNQHPYHLWQIEVLPVSLAIKLNLAKQNQHTKQCWKIVDKNHQWSLNIHILVKEKKMKSNKV